MAREIDTFQPEKRTLGQILSSTSPPIRVPDYQRDFSWKEDQITEFWSDLVGFSGNNPQVELVGKEYFLGAAVLVNNGTYHLLLDGQQRLATATILLAALRDKILDYKKDAAQQIQDQYISFEDQLSGKRIFKIELNIFDRSFFRDYIQAFPRISEARIQKNSHSLIHKAYSYFRERIDEGWNNAGGGKGGFEWAAHITGALRERMVLVTVTSNNEGSAGDIFATLNDRGIGLSTVDQIRTYVLQRAHETQRNEILQCWDEMFNACGTSVAAETLLRMSWVAQHGDVKTRALYKIVSKELGEKVSPTDYSRGLQMDSLFYRQYRDGDTEDADLQGYWLALRVLGFSAAIPVLLAASHELSSEEQRSLAKALVSLVVRHNIVCDRDRGKLESLAFSCAASISSGISFAQALVILRGISPSSEEFDQKFAKLSFSRAEHRVAQYLLRTIEEHMAASGENFVAGPDRVHLEHIYPQNPKDGERWEQHDLYVTRFGNLTLLGKPLNQQIKNSDFATKRQQAYCNTRLAVTQALLKHETWTPTAVEQRQLELAEAAEILWPADLI
jgi:hypothetical protein